jgi:hypothetical protein
MLVVSHWSKGGKVMHSCPRFQKLAVSEAPK